jgi:uncharacterized membrane protein YtjA (UPF0391 family)
MVRWALVFLMVALLAGAMGFGGFSGEPRLIARVLCGTFTVICLASLAASLATGRGSTAP